MEFFAILVPGSIITFTLIPHNNLLFGTDKLFPALPATPAKWTAFFIIAYILGHILWTISSLIMDPIYNRVYRNVKWLPKTEKTLFNVILLITFIKAWKLKSADAVDPHYNTALIIRKKHLNKIGQAAENLENKSLPSWAQTNINLRSITASQEIERIQASSKFFRSMTMALIILLVSPFSQIISINSYELFFLIILLILFGHRFMKLRWDATRIIYEYYIALSLDENRPST
jgi:hypothetical protein